MKDKNEIIKTEAETDIEKYGFDIKVGDEFITSNDNVIRVLEIKGDTIITTSEYSDDLDSTSNHTLDDFKRYNYLKLKKSYAEYEKQALATIADIDNLEDDEEVVESDETALATTSSKAHLQTIKKEMVLKTDELEIMRRIINDKLDRLHSIVLANREQVERMCKVIDVVELYMGIHEEVLQIQQGENAPPDQPLCIRQMILYMDEEVGDTVDGGLDYEDVAVFDDWLLSGNLDKIIPETKGIVILRIRRNDKDYGDRWANAIQNAHNMRTYILVRNGDNVYRIWAPVNIYPRLFPLKKEFRKSEDDRWWNQSEKEGREFDYKKHALLLQGLIERTQIFQPMKPGTSVFKPDTWPGNIKFIFDDEGLLPDGRLLWREWQDKINSLIKEGSRVFYHGYQHHYKIEGHVPYGYAWVSFPHQKVYAVVKPIDDFRGGRFRFMYNPGGEVCTDGYYGCDYHERKNRIGYSFYNDEVLNYDQLSLDDIEFYLHSRVDRRNYLDMLPVLRKIKKARLEELEREKHFVKFLSDRTGKTEEDVWKAVEWWKYKNKWKRPVAEDDAKALRMIESRLNRKGK